MENLFYNLFLLEAPLVAFHVAYLIKYFQGPFIKSNPPQPDTLRQFQNRLFAALDLPVVLSPGDLPRTLPEQMGLLLELNDRLVAGRLSVRI